MLHVLDLVVRHVPKFISRAPLSAAWAVALLVLSTASAIGTPLRHYLFISSVAWVFVAIFYSWRAGAVFADGWSRTRKICTIAGFLYALAQVCERVTLDKENFWWTKALLPLCAYCILRSGLVDTENGWNPYTEHASQDIKEGKGNNGGLILLATGLSAAALAGVWLSPISTTLGICATIATSCALLLLEQRFNAQEIRPTINEMNGSLRHHSSSSPYKERAEAHSVKRDVALTVAIISIIASFSLESFRSDGFTYDKTHIRYENYGGDWKSRQFAYNVWRDVLGIAMETGRATAMLAATQEHGTICVSLISVAAVLLAQQLIAGLSLGLWLTVLYGATTMVVFDDTAQSSSWLSSTAYGRIRSKQAVMLLAAATLALLTLSSALRRPYRHIHKARDHDFPAEPPIELLGPLQFPDTRLHPIDELIKKSEAEFERLLSRQSRSLDEAVIEYKRRYRIPPPPNFDAWYTFAKRKGVQLIDEYDTIFNSLLPFWALEPSVIRSRVSEALGYEGNLLMAATIREGQMVLFEGGQDWHQKATTGMMRDFVQYLPDMDIAFNIHDEPRVILPHDTLSRLVHTALADQMPLALATKEPKNEFSPRPSDMNDGKRIREVKTTRFNRFAHQHTWTHSRMSCSANSPARNFEEVSRDNVTAWALSDLGFVYNQTAFGDICISPSFRSTYGFFERPNAFNIVQDLFPIFSQSKISTFQDILYPSPWYWANKVEHQEMKDMDWSEKETKLYWRGSTTGGFSRDGGWRRQHRQRVVRKLNDHDNAKVLSNKGTADSPNWQPLDVRRQEYADLIDVKFSHIGQCDPGDCDAQREFFQVVERVDQQDAWHYKYLLDMDGNAFSGRFYAFLKSNSLVFKMSLFQEWHRDWLKPWLHYVPLSLRGDEWVEVVRHFAGTKDAPRLAAQSKEWASKALRNEDLEVWFFRLLLEYGRLIDDRRTEIGFAL